MQPWQRKYVAFLAGVVAVLAVVAVLQRRGSSPGPLPEQGPSRQVVRYDPPPVDVGAHVVDVPRVQYKGDGSAVSPLLFASRVEAGQEFVLRGELAFEGDPPSSCAIVAEWIARARDGRQVVGGSGLARIEKQSADLWRYDIPVEAPVDLNQYEVRIRLNDHSVSPLKSVDIARTQRSVSIVRRSK